MKYIVFADNTVCIFPNGCSHKWMASDRVVISAGFCNIETFRDQFDDTRVRVYCYGRSDSLNVDSHKDIDENLIRRMWMS